ncbi:MltA domain-containing protein [Thermaurantiacus sp.]
MSDWTGPCAAAKAVRPGDLRTFLATHFHPIVLGDGRGYATGYFVPEYPAFPEQRAGLVPALAAPVGLDCTRTPCPSRAGIIAGELSGKARPIAWLDPVDLSFLQVQGSGLLRLPDGRLLRLGFAGHNGHPHVPIGRILRARGDLPAGAGMAEIRQWLQDHPGERDALLNGNPRFIFFRVMDDHAPFPVGSLGSRLTAEANVAVDPGHVPMGAIVELETRLGTGQGFRRFLVAADTGSAILGPNRFDIYFGAGPRAADLAGRQQAEARAIIWLPKGSP